MTVGPEISYAACRYAEYHFHECGTQANYAECHYVECLCSKSRGTNLGAYSLKQVYREIVKKFLILGMKKMMSFSQLDHMPPGGMITTLV